MIYYFVEYSFCVLIYQALSIKHICTNHCHYINQDIMLQLQRKENRCSYSMLWSMICFVIVVVMYFFLILYNPHFSPEGNGVPGCYYQPPGQNELRQLAEYYKQKLPDGVLPHDGLRCLLDPYIARIIKELPLHDMYGIINTKTGLSYLTPYIHHFSYEVNESVEKNNNKISRKFGFWIKESYRAQPTAGGSSFDASVMSDYFADKCSLSDYFNGSYFMCCSIQAPCMNVTVTLMYVNFTAFMSYQKLTAINRVIYSTNVCLPSTNTDLSVNAEKTTSNTNVYNVSRSGKPYIKNRMGLQISGTNIMRNMDNFGSGLWIRHHEEWHWIGEGTIYYQPSKTSLGNCLSQFYSVYMFGDSHIRANYLYMLYILGDLHYIHIVKPVFGHVRNIIYQSVTYSVLLANELRKLLDSTVKVRPGKRDVIIMTAGTWDTSFHTMADYILDIKLVFRAIEQLKWHSRWSNAKLIWMTIPPFPNEETYNSNNNFNRAAANAYAFPRLQSLGVKVIDSHTILNPFNNVVMDKAHYISYNITYNTMLYKHGSTPVNKLIHEMCGKTPT